MGEADVYPQGLRQTLCAANSLPLSGVRVFCIRAGM
jgi:hypothetical protein